MKAVGEKKPDDQKGTPLEKFQYVVLNYNPPGGPALQPSDCFESMDALQDALNEWGTLGWEFPNAVIVKEKINEATWGYRLRDVGFNGIDSDALLGRRKITAKRPGKR
jgi:hypothetical protein